jgi:hypothetical protein
LPKERLGGKVGKGQDVKGMGVAMMFGRKRRRRKVAMMFVAGPPPASNFECEMEESVGESV